MGVTQVARKPAAEAQTDAPPAAGSVIGHNRLPPEDQGVADFNDQIDGHDGNLRLRIRDLLASAGRAAATTEEEAGRCAELIRQMTAVEKAVDGVREEVKRPYLSAGRRIDEASRVLIATLGEKKIEVRKLAEDFMRKKAAAEAARRREQEEQQRRERDAAEQRAREEQAAAAAEGRAPDADIMEAPLSVAAKPVEEKNTQVRSDFGAVASARKVKVAVITDWPKAFKAVKSVPAVQEAIQKAINALVRAGQTQIPGVEVKDDIGLSVR